MVKTITFEVEGVDLVVENLDKIKKDFAAKIQQEMDFYMYSVLAKAQFLCPRDTGMLQNSLHVGQESQYTWYFADGVHYGVYQEFGFFHVGAQRFIRNPFAMPAFMATPPPRIELK